MEKRLTRLLCGLALVCLAGLAGCNGEAPPPPAPLTRVNPDAVLTVCFQNHNFNSFVPSELHFYNEAQLMELVFNTLVQADHAGHLAPDLASSWNISSDGLEYTFHLRPNARFSNGSRLTSRDVVFTLEELIRHGDPDGELECIAGAGAYASGETQVVSGLGVVNDHCLRILLARPFNLFLHMLASKAASVIPAGYGGVSREEFRLHPVGTGPFQLMEGPERITIKHQPFLRLSFLRREDYFSGPAGVRRIDIHLPQEPPRANTLYYFDVFLPPEGFAISTVPRSTHRVITTAPDVQVFMALNPEPPGKALPEIWRQILQYGIDRQRLVRDLGLERSALPAYTILPVSLFGHNRYFRLDPGRARQLRAQLPENARATLKVTIYPHHAIILAALNDQLNPLGLYLESEVLPPGPYYADMWNRRRQAMIVRGVADYPHAYNFLSQLYKCKGLLNYFVCANTEIISRIDRLPLVGIRQQAALLEELADLCTRDAWYIPLYFLSDNFVLRMPVNPLRFKFGGIIDFHSAEVNHESIDGSD